MRVRPISLATRTVLLVIAIVAVAEVATFSVMSRNRYSQHSDQLTRSIAGQIRLLQRMLPSLDAKARQRLAEEEIGEPGMQLHADDAQVPPDDAFDPPFVHRLSHELDDLLGEEIELRHAGPGGRPGIWIGFRAGDERWWLILPPPRFEPPRLPHGLWWWLGGTLILVIGIGILFVRGIVKPLARLGEAVDATGDGSPQRVFPEGPEEVCRLARRHNAMVERLAEADAERSEMLAGLTHDLRAPLARMRVRLALLENDTDRDGLARDTDDMERIVGQCLAFLRSERAANEPIEPLLLADAVSDEVARQRELERPIEILVEPEAAALEVTIAHGNLQRILDNLIANALQYGAPPVEISVRRGAPGSVLLAVRDHGPGIAPEQRARAFEAFAQIDPARATRGSCGLGLAIVHRLVLAAGGTVSLDQASGGGLLVELQFPVAAR